MPSETLFDLTTDLRALGGGRVWSLMTSLFGDLAQGEGDKIEGPVLSSIMAELGVKPEAARVALHRLRNDGWITSQKAGRISHHSLTAKGRQESALASPRIYAQPKGGAQEWQMVMTQTVDATLPEPAFLQLLPRLFVAPKGTPVPDNALMFEGGTAPDWLTDDLIPQTLRHDYAKLHETLATLATALPGPQTLGPTDIALLRCLVVHNWRRLVLKHTMPPAGLINDQSALHKCHVVVADLLARYPRPALAALTQDHAGA